MISSLYLFVSMDMLRPAMTNCLHYLVLLLLSSLLLSSVLAKVFVSIDCGSSLSSYTDKHGIEWVGDNLYTKHGENQNVFLSTVPGGWDSHVISTLRVFTDRKKNCYSIEADKGERVFIRAGFLYGNYDNKSSLPTFNMHVDGNHWTRVILSSMNTLNYYEAAFTVKGNTLSVCLAQTEPDQFPFISSLEVRSFDAAMYSYIDPNYPLYFGWRYALGAINSTRYPDDVYDRIWQPVLIDNQTETRVTSDSPIVSLDDAEDNPPRSAMQTAVTLLNVSDRVLSFYGDASAYPSPFYFNCYFSEVSKLNSTQKRSFQVNVNNNTVNNGRPISPPYGGVLELIIPNVTATNNTAIDLVRTSDSTLPPIFNALEMVYAGPKQTEGTDPIDVKSLAVLQKSFIQLQDWTGDPCLPSPYTWDWVGCSSAIDNPRITALYLGDLGLVGTLPDFSGLDALEIIDLHNNSLVQEFPDFLGSFPVLKKLNLANNNFSGTVPPSLLEKEDLSLNVTGNPHLQLCRSNESCETETVTEHSSPNTPQASGNSKLKSTNTLPIILGIVIPVLLLDVFWVVVC